MATLKQRGRAWQLNWSDAEGQHRVSLGKVSRTEATAALRAKQLELLTGRRVAPAGQTLRDFSVDYLAWYASHYPSTYKRTEAIIRLQLLPEFGSLALDDIRAPDVTRWITKRRAGDKTATPPIKPAEPATVTKEARALQAMLNRAVEWGAVEKHALATFKAPPERSSKPVEFYTAADLTKLYNASQFHADIWRLLANTGLRRNEALYLKRADVSDMAITVRSENERPTKTRRWREVPLNANARAAIKALDAKAKGPYLLPRVAPPSLSRAFVICAKRAKLSGSLHTLRHTFISQMVMAGVDLPTVQKIAGHATITTTMRYAHLSPEHRQAAVDKIAL